MAGRIGRIVIYSLCIISLSRTGLAANRLRVFVSIVPQKYFLQQIGKGLVDVHVMVQPGASPAIYEPRPKQMALISKTDFYFAVGVPFENVWLKKIAAANPKMKMIHTDSGINKIPMAAHDHATDDKDRGKDMHHGEHAIPDPHIWLSPPLVKLQARTILNALKDADPSHGKEYDANYGKFVSEIDRLDAELRQTFADKKGLQFMVFHPSWGYFAQTYGLKQIPVEVEGKNPKPSQLKDMIEHAKERGIRVIFVQPQFSTKSAKLVAKELGGQIIFADPLAENWLANLKEVAAKFKQAIK